MLKPTILPEWATTNVVDPVTGQNNVLEPPDSKKLIGWNHLEFPPRNWFNWLALKTYQWLSWFNQQESQSVVTNATGLGLFPTDGSLIEIYAQDMVTTANFYWGMGCKLPGQAPIFSSFNSNVLTLGTGTIAGDQPITGGSGTLIVYGQSKIIPS